MANDRPDCDYCNYNSTIGFSYSFASMNEDSKQRNAVEALKKLKNLRYGKLYQCAHCQSSWYFDHDRDWMQRVLDSRLPLIDSWNENSIFLPSNQIRLLDIIGSTPTDLYGNGEQYTEFPCKVITKSGKTIETAIICFQIHAPIEESRQYRLASDIAELCESPYALPLDVRKATTRAAELRMGFAPINIEVNGQTFTLNSTTNFFRRRNYNAKAAKVAMKKFDFKDTFPITNDPTNITYFIADPIM